jgi:hypothetical protein
MAVMAAFRWFLVLAFSVLADFANPALPGMVEAFAEAEEGIHTTWTRRQRVAQDNDDQESARRLEAAKTVRAMTFQQRLTRSAAVPPAAIARKVPLSAVSDAPTAPDDH